MKIEDSILIDLLNTTDNKNNLQETFAKTDINIPYIITSAEKHLIKTRILNSIGKITPSSHTDKSIFDNIKQSVINNTLVNIHIQKEIIQINSLLNTNNINTIVLKGPTLDDSGLRDIGDIDILINPEDLIKTKGILENNLYRYTGTIENKLLTKNEKENIMLQMSWNSQYQFRHKKNNMLLEIHINIFDKARVYDINLDHLLNSIDSFWQRKTWSEVLHCYTFNKEDSLILMCMHNAIKRSPANNRFTLRNLVDIEYLIKSGIDWNDFFTRTKELKIAPFMLFSLQMAQQYLKSKIPDYILYNINHLCSPLETRMVRMHQKCIISLNKISIIYSNIYKILIPFVFHSSWKLRIKRILLFNIIFPPLWRMSAIFNISTKNPFIFFTYLINPVRWIYIMIRNILI